MTDGPIEKLLDTMMTASTQERMNAARLAILAAYAERTEAMHNFRRQVDKLAGELAKQEKEIERLKQTVQAFRLAVSNTTYPEGHPIWRALELSDG